MFERNKIYFIFKNIYYRVPFKGFLFNLVKRVYSPSVKLAGYLKFKGTFKLVLKSNKSLKLLNDNSTIPSLLFWKGYYGYEPKSLMLWEKLSMQSTNILDIGANFGLFGLIAKTVNPNANIMFFEPLERNVNRIVRNLLINQYEEKVFQIALTNKTGKVKFFDMDSDENTIGSIYKSFVLSHSHHKDIIEIEVNAFKLDDFVDEYRVKKIDLMKIDVEGAEYQILEGFINYIHIFKPIIFIEISSQETADLIDDFLNNLPFKYLKYQINDFSSNNTLIQCDALRKGQSRNFILSIKDLNKTFFSKF